MSKTNDDNCKSILHIIDNYEKLEASIVTQLQMAAQHGVVTGTFREELWLSLFERIIPKKFSIARSVFIIDSLGNFSKEVDLAIFDEQYTPYIFNYGVMKFIPIEAVAVVVQCKGKDLKGLYKWTNSIELLRTSMMSIARQFYSVSTGELGCDQLGESGKPITQTSTRPIKILCTTEHRASATPYFDLTISPQKDATKLQIQWNDESRLLSDWLDSLNHAGFNPQDPESGYQYSKIVMPGASSLKTTTPLSLSHYKVIRRVSIEKEPPRDVSLLSLTFQLNQLLMLINNPMMFPHYAYVRMFNRMLGSEEELAPIAANPKHSLKPCKVRASAGIRARAVRSHI
ncbi:DUF6602 domain-containing protein [Paenibacillus sp. YYML68]|uniref:DUF6602 domain-containing protein n=1 Tax=Paenibacillus sp. YYML68 TaxID=2909250 RepID=UPI00248F7145|nr:DUF6602 domain-containing protein [Paenibacillus sp. YYML68]